MQKELLDQLLQKIFNDNSLSLKASPSYMGDVDGLRGLGLSTVFIYRISTRASRRCQKTL